MVMAPIAHLEHLALDELPTAVNKHRWACRPHIKLMIDRQSYPLVSSIDYWTSTYCHPTDRRLPRSPEKSRQLTMVQMQFFQVEVCSTYFQ